jgi:hypothetical protein
VATAAFTAGCAEFDHLGRNITRTRLCTYPAKQTNIFTAVAIDLGYCSTQIKNNRAVRCTGSTDKGLLGGGSAVLVQLTQYFKAIKLGDKSSVCFSWNKIVNNHKILQPQFKKKTDIYNNEFKYFFAT